MAEYDLKNLQRDIDLLCESNRMDYQDLAENRHSSQNKTQILEAISLRNADLLRLLRKKWALEGAPNK